RDSSFLTHVPRPRLHLLSLHDALPICAPRAVGSHVRIDGDAHRRTDRLAQLALSPDGKLLAVANGHSDSVSLVDTARSLPSGLRSEEHTSELQSRSDIVCRLLLEKKKQ